MFMIVCTISGYLTATLLFNVAPALLPGRRYLMIAAISVLAPSLAYLIVGLGFGTYSRTILSFIGVGALYTFVIDLFEREREHWVVAGAVAP